MKTQLILLLAFLLSISLSVHSQKRQTVRLMTYNIRNGMGMDNQTDYARTASVINKWHPDILAAQEIDSVTNRSNHHFVIQEIAKQTGMNFYFAPAIDYDGGKYGIGILSKEKAISFYHIPLPGQEEERTMLIAEFPTYYFISIHLSLTPEDQIKSFSIINREIKKLKKPVFIAGDFNAEPESEPIKLLQQNFKILSPIGAKTYPADHPLERIDYIAITKKDTKIKKSVKTFVVNETEASDHRPIIVDLEIGI